MSGEKNQGRNRGIEKYLPIILIALILFVGLNRFVFSNSNQPPASAGGNTLEEMAVAYYVENYGEQGNIDELEATVQNFGCHREIYLYQDSQVVLRLAYSNGEFFEIK